MNIKRIFSLLFLVFALLGCSHPLTTPSDVSIIEGTVKYIPGNTIGFGYNMGGFILSDYQWITEPTDSTNGLIYLSGKVDSSFINKRVQAVGKVSSSTIYGTFVMNVDTLKVVN